MTIVVVGDDNTLEQVRKQLGKLVPVVKVRDFKDVSYVERDMVLVTIAAESAKRNEVVEIVNLFRGHVVDVSRNSLMVQLAGAEEKVEAMLELLKPYGIKEMARTGVIAMARGQQLAKDEADTKDVPKGRKRSKDAPAAQALPPS